MTPKREKTDPGILFLIPYKHWELNPTIIGILKRLRNSDCPIDLVSPSPKKIEEYDHFYLSQSSWAVKGSWQSRLRYLKKDIIHFGEKIRDLTQIKKLKKSISMKSYSKVVAVDPQGMALADKLDIVSKDIDLVYLSFEILFREDAQSKDDRKLCKIERAMVKKATTYITQDFFRQKQLIKQLPIESKKCFLVPVAPEIPQKQALSDRILFKTKSEKILLYCGNIENWNIKHCLEEIAIRLPEGYKFRIHTSFPVSPSLLNRISELEKKGRVKFTNGFLSEKDHLRLLNTADIGFAPYFPNKESWMTHNNLFHLGLSSTKVAYFSALGLPMITTSLPSLKYFWEKYPFGALIRNIDDFNSSLEWVEDNYEDCSINAQLFYQEVLEPSFSLDQICQELMFSV
jgi:glycosyltransferase involved in cell wall biosynthesis